AVRYGECLADFISATSVPRGPFDCRGQGVDARRVRELLLRAGGPQPAFLASADGLPSGLRSLLGPRWTLLGDTLVVIGIVDERGQLRLLYNTRGTGGVYDATIVDGTIRATLTNRSTIVVSPEDEGTVTWVSADKSRTLKGALRRLSDP